MLPAWLRKVKMPFLYRFVLCITDLFFRVFYRHRVYGLEHFYADAAIIAANHTSFLDPPIAAISWPEEVHFLARESLFRHRFFGAFIRALNAHPVSGEVSDIGVFKTVCQLLTQGKKVILFPEGKRSYSNELGPIKPGIALLVSRTNAAVIPAYIHGAYEIWGRKRHFPKCFGKTACVFGSPILWAAFAKMEKRAAQEALGQQIAHSILSLKKWYEEGAKGSPP